MSSVDTRVVEMQFDNRQFEKGIQTSLDSLAQLDKSVNNAGSSKGMGGLASAVETVQARFSAMEVIAVTALANITNSAVNAGKKLLSSLTIAPVKTGFDEYETQISSIQTILANTESKGTTLDQVNEALDTLNHYADKTIYNFTQMTKNIGTFTAAGIDLETAVNAIQGIANLAAVSGSTSQQASTAMYQLSQALASGTVKLIDWNSVVNAGMGGQVFQDALKETARVHGIKIDEMIKNEGSFRESLKNGWLTSEILTDTLQKFTLATEEMTDAQVEEARSLLKTKGYTDEQIESIFKLGNTATQAATKVKTFTQLMDTLKESAQSGWTQTWETLIGDFEEAKYLWTKINDVVGGFMSASANARNEMLQGWKDLGGRAALIDALKNAFDGLVSVVTPIKEAFREIFPQTTAKQLFLITEGLKKFTATLKLSGKNSDNLKRTFKGVFALFGIAVDIIKSVAKGFANLVGYVAPVGDSFLSITASIGDTVVAFRDFLKSSNIFNKAIGKIVSVLGTVITGVRTFVSNVAEAIRAFATVDTTPLDQFAERVNSRFEPLTKLGEGIKKFFNGVVALLKKVAPTFLTLAGFIGDVFASLGEGIVNGLTTGDFTPLIDMINGLLSGALILSIRNLLDALGDSIGILSAVGDVLEGWSLKVKADAIIKIAVAVAILAAALILITTVDSEKLNGAMASITGLFLELYVAMLAFVKITKDAGVFKVTSIATSFIGLSIAILILASAITKLAKLDWSRMATGLVGVAGLMAIMVAAAKSISKFEKKFRISAIGVIGLSVAILILSSAVAKLGSLDVGSLAKGLVGVGVLCAELALFMKTTDLNKMGMFKGLGLLLLATAINVLANAVGKFGAMDVGSMAKGLAGVAIVLAELAIFTKLTGDAKKVISTATGLVILGAAMLIFAEAINNMGSLSIGQIAKGLVTMAGALTILIVAMKMMPKSIIFTSTSVVVLASALLILGAALKNMGGMSMSEIGRGLLLLASSLTIIVVALKLMTGALVGAAALLVISTALVVLAGALKIMGSQSMSEIGKAMLTLLGVFVVFGAAAFVLAPLTPVLLALGAAIALLGVGCLATGVGLLAFASGLTALAVAGTAGSAALVLMITTLIGLIPAVIKAIGLGLVAICKVIADSTTGILEALASIIVALMGAISKSIPAIISCLGLLLDSLLMFILTYVPKLIDTGVQLILALLQGIADNIPKIVAVAVSIVTNFLSALGQEFPKIVDAGFNMIISFIDGLTRSITENGPRLQESCKQLGIAIIDGITGGLYSKLLELRDMIFSVGQGIIDWFKEKLGIHSPSTVFNGFGGNIIQGLINGIGSKVSGAFSTIKNVASNCINAFKDKVSGFASAGKDAIGGFVSGVQSKLSAAANAAANVGKTALNSIKKFLGINSPSKEFAEVGKYSDEGLAYGLKKFAGHVSKSASNVGETAIDSLNKSIKSISDVVNGNMDTTPTIRPVIDLSDIEAGSKEMHDMFDETGVLNVNASSARASAINGRMNADASDVGPNNNQNGTSINFTQNNYSPKALSKTDIYRQTKNQFSMMKGALNKS